MVGRLDLFSSLYLYVMTAAHVKQYLRFVFKLTATILILFSWKGDDEKIVGKYLAGTN
jgi:hypothetical protein